MKLTVLGVKLVKGLSKANSTPFAMCRLFATVAIEAGGSEKVQVRGAGFELAEMNLDEEALAGFMALKFPITLELTTDSKPYRGKFETIVTGFVAPASGIKAA